MTKFKQNLEDGAAEHQREQELAMVRRRQELEDSIFARNAKLQDALLEKDRLREEESATLQLELEAKYDERVALLEIQERQLENEKVFVLNL